MYFKVFLNIFSGLQFNHGLTRMDTDLASVFKRFYSVHSLQTAVHSRKNGGLTRKCNTTNVPPQDFATEAQRHRAKQWGTLEIHVF
jgi:hypothetical protein